MRFLKQRHVLIMVALFAALVIPFLAVAQAGTQLLINYPEIAEQDDGLLLGLYFNILDAAGSVVPNAQIAQAQMLLDDGTRYEATAERPESPIYIALVLDASGSMGGAAAAMRQAAIDAVNGAPEEAQFAVIRFNNNIDILTSFTTDRNAVQQAIQQVQPINLAGTCLYDAMFRALETMSSVPAGRRAIIAFTDGRDETAQGTVCSQHVVNDVISLANSPQTRTPIHTIGLSGGNSAINAGELRDIASSTGGLSAIGDQGTLGGLFGQIMEALRNQWVARALTYPSAGQHTVTLSVRLSDGNFPQPAVAVFISPSDYERTPTITPTQPTSTPTIITVTVDSVRIDPAAETISVQARTENGDPIRQYRFEFMNQNNLLQAEFVIDAGQLNSATFPSRTLADGDSALIVTALDGEGRIIARAEPFEFTYLGPTATPPPPTSTPEAISATLTSIQYDEDEDVITLNLDLLGAARIEELQIDVTNGDTRLLEETYRVEPGTTAQISGAGLTPGQDYLINVIARGENGEIFSQSDSEFTYTPLLTPTPTPVVVEVAITGIEPNSNFDTFVVRIRATNEREIQRYELRFVDAEQQTLVRRFEYEPPPYDTLNVPMGDIPGGQYEITVNAFGPGSTLLATNMIEARITPPTPTPTITPLPFPANVIERARENPIIVVVIGAVLVALILLVFILVRQPKKQKTGTGFLSEMTQYGQAKPKGDAKKTLPSPGLPADDKTNAEPYRPNFAEATNPIAAILLPHATLTINNSRDASRVGKTILVTHVPFRIGRRKGDLMLEGDDNVSREHAEITFTDRSFFIADLGSTHGTFVNGTRLPGYTPTPVRKGSRITIGTTTEIVFDTDADDRGGGMDDTNMTVYG